MLLLTGWDETNFPGVLNCQVLYFSLFVCELVGYNGRPNGEGRVLAGSNGNQVDKELSMALKEQSGSNSLHIPVVFMLLGRENGGRCVIEK